MNQQIRELMKQAGTDCSGKWMGMNHAEKFAELIIRQCSSQCGSQADQRNILTSFGLEVESNIKYPGPEKSGSTNSQYEREYNLPKG
jgi:uncharacterized protein with NRDE domain